MPVADAEDPADHRDGGDAALEVEAHLEPWRRELAPVAEEVAHRRVETLEERLEQRDLFLHRLALGLLDLGADLADREILGVVPARDRFNGRPATSKRTHS